MIMYFAFKTFATVSRLWGLCPLFSSLPREFAIQNQKTNANARGLARAGGGGGAHLELTDALLKHSLPPNLNVVGYKKSYYYSAERHTASDGQSF